MSTPTERLAQLGISLPEAPKPVAAYVPAVRSGRLIFVSGQIPMRDGELIAVGRIPTEVDFETVQTCARQCVLNGLAVLRDAVGSLDSVTRVVRLGCFIASEPGFSDQPKIANGASELMLEIFGEAGRHARAAVGSVALPLGAPIEIEFLFEVE